MKDKYYTPTKEEFHVGFEYEVFQKGEEYNPNFMYLMTPDTEDKWVKFTFPDPFLGYNLDRMFKTYNMRVKHLDKDDIEKLGFNTEDNGECYNKSIGWMIIGIYPWEDVNGEPNEYKISVDMNTNFHGIIKNKSELKRLLKQLNIL